jgi:hypothetical protein
MRINFLRAILAGLAGTVVFDVAGLLMKGAWWDTPATLGSSLGVGMLGGVPAHYGIGVILAIIYAGLAPSLWGPNWVRALTYMTAQTVFGVWFFMMPMMGAGIAGLETGPLTPIVSLAGHWAYGLVLGLLYPVPQATTAQAQ